MPRALRTVRPTRQGFIGVSVKGWMIGRKSRWMPSGWHSPIAEDTLCGRLPGALSRAVEVRRKPLVGVLVLWVLNSTSSCFRGSSLMTKSAWQPAPRTDAATPENALSRRRPRGDCFRRCTRVWSEHRANVHLLIVPWNPKCQNLFCEGMHATGRTVATFALWVFDLPLSPSFSSAYGAPHSRGQAQRRINDIQAHHSNAQVTPIGCQGLPHGSIGGGLLPLCRGAAVTGTHYNSSLSAGVSITQYRCAVLVVWS
jgi:hypothetical protein